MSRADIPSLTERLRKTVRCRQDVKEAAEFFSDLDLEAYEALIRHLIDEGEDRALAILLNVCAINQFKLPPELLVETLGAVEPLTDFAAPFYMQDQRVIAPLLGMSAAAHLSWQRQVFAARLAAELTVRFKQDPTPVKRVLRKLSHHPLDFETELFNAESLALLEAENIPDNVPWLTQGDPLKNLPQEKPPVVIGGSYTVKRPIPKLGRNEPCHCGSGKKYKKCCIEKDRVLMRDASPYEGLTMTELKSRPGVVDDPMVIEKMRAYDLKKLDPPNLGSRQLFTAYRRCDTFGLYELASAMLVELQSRSASEDDFDPGHFQDLMESALSAGNLEAAKKIRALIPGDQLCDPEEVEFRFAFLENPSLFKSLESLCRKALTGKNEEWDDSLIATSHAFENIFPALSIVFSRAAIIGAADRPFDQETLLDIIHTARMDLDLDAWGDPVEEYLDWVLDKNEADVQNDIQNTAIDDLRDEVSQAKQIAAQRLKHLKDKERELEDLNRRLREMEKNTLSAPQPKSEAPAISDPDRQIILKLRQRIEDLKHNISEGQQERRNLRKQIQKALERAEDPVHNADRSHDADGGERPVALETGPKNILFPEFTDDYRNKCKSIAGSVVMKSLKAAAGFAAHDRSVWRQTKALAGMTSIYSIRVGIHHRLLIRWEKDIRLEVLDLIPREQLDSWIKVYRKGNQRS